MGGAPAFADCLENSAIAQLLNILARNLTWKAG
jgi:hypothetical protein